MMKFILSVRNISNSSLSNCENVIKEDRKELDESANRRLSSERDSTFETPEET